MSGVRVAPERRSTRVLQLKVVRRRPVNLVVRVRGETPLHRAAAWGSPEVIQLLLDAGADPTIRDANNDTPLSWASWHLRDKSIIDQLWYEGSGVGPDFPPHESRRC